MATSYEAMLAHAMQHYQAGAYADALAALDQHGDLFPEQASMILYLRSCMAARTDQQERALDLIQQALDRGFWYSRQVMRETPSWQGLQGLPAFEHMVAICEARQTQAEAEARPQRFVAEPVTHAAPPQGYPLCIALHGNGDNGRAALRGWQPMIDHGWLLVAMQSSQIVAHDGFAWDDQERAQREIAAQYDDIRAQYAIDPRRIILAGFSMGAETALRLALTGDVPARGFILLGPGGPLSQNPDEWRPLIEQRATSGLRGYILLGEDDQVTPPDSIEGLAELLNAAGVACGYERIPGLGHAYPPDMARYLTRAVRFIDP